MTIAIDIPPRGRPQYEIRFVNGPATCGPRRAPKGADVTLAIALVRLELLAEGVPEEWLRFDAAVAQRIDQAGVGGRA
jgi:hypothetical protein